METLEPNGERGRSKPRTRSAWASALVRPGTVKALLALMPMLIKLISSVIELVKAIRN